MNGVSGVGRWGFDSIKVRKSSAKKNPNNNNKTLLIKIKIYKFKPLCLMHRGREASVHEVPGKHL